MQSHCWKESDNLPSTADTGIKVKCQRFLSTSDKQNGIVHEGVRDGGASLAGGHESLVRKVFVPGGLVNQEPPAVHCAVSVNVGIVYCRITGKKKGSHHKK